MSAGVFSTVMQVRIGDRRIGLPAESVRDVFDLDGLAPVPLAPPVIVGLATHRGRNVCVLSLAELLGLPACVRQDAPFAVGVEWNGQSVALEVDTADDVVALPVSETSDATFFHPAVRRYLSRGDASVAEIDINTLFETLHAQGEQP